MSEADVDAVAENVTSLLMDDKLGRGNKPITVMEGYLIKRGQVRKSYKKRFCSLSMGRLDYFLDLNDGKDVKKLEHKGAFELVDVTLVLCRETYELLRASAKKGKEGELPEGLPDDQADAKEEGAEKKKGGGFMSMFKSGKDDADATPWGFNIRTDDRCLTLYAEDRSTMEKWIRKIARCCLREGRTQSNVAKEGFLLKSAGKDEPWKMRYVVVSPYELKYYEDSDVEKLKFSMELTDVRVGMVEEPAGLSSTKWYVAGKDNSVFLEADNEGEANAWGAVIRGCISYTQNFQPTIYTGWLVKTASSGSSTLTRRFFVLIRGVLMYYPDELQRERLGEVTLKHPLEVRLPPNPELGFRFTISSAGKVLEAMASSFDKMKAWETALHSAAI